ncbi:uncharacterized protein B0T23DRAFT_457346 [Neurospora hispaniola]|uniref:Uncharacterized protein n=1 Tax=Neurospora hispaniola TaxID=588809 RepID=A0AAJ0HZ11_9PEZI|nr:hypothetical protein B0T23DRAFT_457346 [Neurospora hispaniola]
MATTHRDHLPGTYPDSNPATPNEQGLAPQNQSYIQSHDQRNKLHKSTDPRSHNFSDARLGNIESQPIGNESDISQRHFNRDYSGEAVGGGFYNHDSGPTIFNSQHPRVSQAPQRTLQMENTDGEAALGDQQEYTFSKPVPTVAKEQGFREVDARQAPEQGVHEVGSRPEVDSHPEARRANVATFSQGAADEQPSNIRDKSSNDDATSRTSHTSGTAPYWGDLPKASQGGIYNTVTGHGSARDDHDEHHHLPHRSAEDSDIRLHVTGLGTDVPSGGVYNTVAGHGSSDEESKRHLEDSNHNYDNLKLNIPENDHAGAATINSTEAVFDAPLAAVPEDKTWASNSFSQVPTGAPDAGTVTGTDRKDIAPGFLPELAAADDAKLLAESATKRKERAGSTANDNVFDAHAHGSYRKDSTTSAGSNAQNSDVKAQRAFPLTSKHATTADVSMAKDDAGSSPNQHHSRHKDAFVAGAAGLGAGAAASHLAKKHQDDELREIKDRNAQKNLGEDTLAKEWDTVPENLDHPARNYPRHAAAVSHRRKSQELNEAGVIPISGTTLEKVKHKEEEKPLGEDTLNVWGTTPENLQKPATRHTAHGVNVQQPAAENRLAKQPSPAGSNSSEGSSKGEKKHRGLLGIFHRHKDDKEENTTATESPKSPKDKSHSKLKKDAALAGTGAAAGYGLAHHHSKDDKDAANQPTELDQNMKRRASEAAAPVAVSHRRNPSDAQSAIPHVPAVGATSAGAPSHSLSQAQREHAPASKIPVAADHNIHHRMNSNTAHAGMAGATLAGVAGGIGAAKYASAHDDKETIHPEQDVSHAASGVGAPAAAGTGAVTSGGLYHTENPRQPPTDSSTNPSGVKPNENLARNTAQEPGYNVLMSGTPSGVQPMSTHGHDGKHAKTTNEPGNYNHLHTGTPSGVAMDTANVGRARSEDQPRTTQKPGNYKHLASGTPSGVMAGATSQPSARRASEGVKRNAPAAGGSDSEEGLYNVLSSGTPSGVKISPRHSRHSSRSSEPVIHADHQDKDGMYRTLASGTATGLNVAAMHENRDKAMKDVKDEVHEQSAMNTLSSKSRVNQHSLPPAESQPIAALSPAEHHKNQDTAAAAPTHHTTARRTQDQYKPVLSAEPPQQFMSPEVMPDAYTTSVPGRNSGAGSGPALAPAATEPMRAKHMSPMVMPDAYTASAPGHSGAEKINSIPESTGHTYGSAAAQPAEAKHMSPEEMPAAYTASAPGHSGAEKLAEPKTTAPRSDKNLALAAASGAWAARSTHKGVSEGSDKEQRIHKPVFHKCQHCGKDNDVSDVLDTVLKGESGRQ